MTVSWQPTRLSEVLRPAVRAEVVTADSEYRLLGVRLDGGGPFLREVKLGTQLSATTLNRVAAGDFIYSRLFAWRGAFGVIPKALDGCYVSSEFPAFVVRDDRIDVEFLRLWFRLRSTLAVVEADCTGSTPLTRNRFKEHFFLALEVPLPPLDEQRRIVARIEEVAGKIEEARGLRKESDGNVNQVLFMAIEKSLAPHFVSGALAPAASFCEQIVDCKHYTPSYVETGFPAIRTSEVRVAMIDLIAARRVNEVDFSQMTATYLPQRGDVLYAREGNWGDAGVIETDESVAISQRVMLFCPDRRRILPRYLMWVLNSPQVRRLAST